MRILLILLMVLATAFYTLASPTVMAEPAAKALERRAPTPSYIYLANCYHSDFKGALVAWSSEVIEAENGPISASTSLPITKYEIHKNTTVALGHFKWETANGVELKETVNYELTKWFVLPGLISTHTAGSKMAGSLVRNDREWFKCYRAAFEPLYQESRKQCISIYECKVWSTGHSLAAKTVESSTSTTGRKW